MCKSENEKVDRVALGRHDLFSVSPNNLEDWYVNSVFNRVTPFLTKIQSRVNLLQSLVHHRSALQVASRSFEQLLLIKTTESIFIGINTRFKQNSR